MCIVASVVDDLRKLDRLLSSREYILYGHFDLDDDTTAFPGELRAPMTLWRSERRIPERRWPEIYYRQYTKPVAALDSPSHGIAYSELRVHNVVGQ